MLIRIGQTAGNVFQIHPGDVLGLMIRVILRGQVPARGLQEEMVDDLVDAVVVPGEPVVDRRQMTQNPAPAARSHASLSEAQGQGENLFVQHAVTDGLFQRLTNGRLGAVLGAAQVDQGIDAACSGSQGRNICRRLRRAWHIF